MMTHDEVADYLLAMPQSWLDFPFGEEIEVYKYGQPDDENAKMFALIEAGSHPLKLTLRCDPQLANLLQERYETVLPGQRVNKKHWITVICSGQLSDEEIKGFIRHSYQLASHLQ